MPPYRAKRETRWVNLHWQVCRSERKDRWGFEQVLRVRRWSRELEIEEARANYETHISCPWGKLIAYWYLFTRESLDVCEQDGDLFIAVNINFVELLRLKVSNGLFLFQSDITDHLLGHERRQNCVKYTIGKVRLEMEKCTIYGTVMNNTSSGPAARSQTWNCTVIQGKNRNVNNDGVAKKAFLMWQSLNSTKVATLDTFLRSFRCEVITLVLAGLKTLVFRGLWRLLQKVVPAPKTISSHQVFKSIGFSFGKENNGPPHWTGNIGSFPCQGNFQQGWWIWMPFPEVLSDSGRSLSKSGAEIEGWIKNACLFEDPSIFVSWNDSWRSR